MKSIIKRILYSDGIVIIGGLIIVPILSFVLLSISPESPLYTSISSMAWIHNLWTIIFIWAIIVMGIISWVTFRVACTGVLDKKGCKKFVAWQWLCVLLVFVGCVFFPSKQGPENILFVNYVHDYLTAVPWAMFVIGLIVYSFQTMKKDVFLGKFSLGLMSFVVFSSLFFLIEVIDPKSFVIASAVSEVYIINNLSIYLVVMYVVQKHKDDKQININKYENEK